MTRIKIAQVRTTLWPSLPLMLMLMTHPANADDRCSVPMDQWQTRQAVQEMIEAHGWVVSHITIDESCYEVHARDPERRSIEIRVDPGSLAIFSIEHEHHD